MKIIHINDKLDISGGVEVSIRDVMLALQARGVEAHWIAIKREGREVHMQGQDTAFNWRGPLSKLHCSPLASLISANTILHVHSLSEPEILRRLFEFAPVVRHLHEQRVFCPGQGKFWAASETICNRPTHTRSGAAIDTQSACSTNSQTRALK